MKKLLLQLGIACMVMQANAQWITNGPAGQEIGSLAVSGTSIFAGSFANGLYVSTNNGGSWSSVSNGLTGAATVNALLVNGSTIYLGTFASGAYQSTNNGSTWTPVSGISSSAIVYKFAASGSIIAAATDGGVVISTNGGTTWNTMNNGLEGYYNTHALAFKGDTIFAGTDNGLSYTTDTGANWNATSLSAVVSAITIADSTIFVGCIDGGGVYRSGNGGSWTAINNGLPLEEDVSSFLADGSTLYMAGGGGIFFTTNNGASWDSIATGQNDISVSGANSLALSGTTLFVGTDNGVYQAGLGTLQGITEISDPEADFKLYPNPTNNNFVIETTGTGWQQLQVADMAGQLLLQLPVTGSKTPIDASPLAAGIYIVSLKNAGQVATEKLVVTK